MTQSGINLFPHFTGYDGGVVALTSHARVCCWVFLGEEVRRIFTRMPFFFLSFFFFFYGDQLARTNFTFSQDQSTVAQRSKTTVDKRSLRRCT